MDDVLLLHWSLEKIEILKQQDKSQSQNTSQIMTDSCQKLLGLSNYLRLMQNVLPFNARSWRLVAQEVRAEQGAAIPNPDATETNGVNGANRGALCPSKRVTKCLTI